MIASFPRRTPSNAYGFSCILILYSDYTSAVVKLLMDYIASFPIDCGVDAKHLRIMASMGGDFPHERLQDLHGVDDLFHFVLQSAYARKVCNVIENIRKALMSNTNNSEQDDMRGKLHKWTNESEQTSVSLQKFIWLRGDITHGNVGKIKKQYKKDVVRYSNFLKGRVNALQNLLT
jgi:hypothetical protein